MFRFLAAASAAIFAVPACAQALAPVAPPQAVAMAMAPATMLRTGMTIPMKTKEQLTTKEKALRVGQRVALETAEDIRLNGQIIIPAGSPGVAEITSVRNKGMWGKSGYVNARVLYVRVGDRQIRLTGTFDDKGKTGTGGVVASIALIPVAGFFTTGTSATIPLGAPVTAFLDEDVPVAFAAASAPAPLTVPVAAPVATMTAAPTGEPTVIPAVVTTVSTTPKP